ncbi:restriction endonuclease subunit S [Vibrio splendidus]
MTGRYKEYPEYKDSEVEWLESLPSSWQIIKVKFLLKDGSEGIKIGPFGSALKLEDMVESGIRVYGQENVIKKDFTLGKRFISQEKYSDMKVYTVEAGDILITMMGTSGKCQVVPESAELGIIDSHLLKLRTNSKILPELFRLLVDETQEIKDQIGKQGKGSIMHGLNSSIVKELELPLPSLEEQARILNFFNHETAKIDTLITKQEKLIGLLKDKRQAVISHAVTKGLNPDAPMKDSGVEWLGKVPEHWFVVPIKRMCEVKDGTHDTPKYLDKGESSFPLITSKDFEGKNISFENAKYISKEAHREIVKRSNTEVGDVLMSMIGGNIGKALIVKETAEFSIKNVALFKTTRKRALASYILYYLESGLLDIQISLQSRGGAQGFLSLGDLRNLVFFKVPEDELNTIVEHLDLKISKCDRLINIASDKITLLSERKTALISAAVTGKIDVRDWQPKGVQG